MKREEAEAIYGMIAGVYDLHPERRAVMAVVWIPALEQMDATIVMMIIEAWMKGDGPERMPTLVMFASDVKAATARARGETPPSTGYSCDVCEDNGLVSLEQEGPYQADAPCPACERGKRREFPIDSVGPWGEEGFWRGKRWERSDHQEVRILA
jgi:hypothetical protein